MPVLVPISNEYIRPEPIVAITPPTTIRGVVWPVLVTLLPETIRAIDMEMINGRFRTPEIVGLTFWMLWK